MKSRRKAMISAILAIGLGSIYVASTFQSPVINSIEKSENFSPTGSEIESKKEYRFTEVDGEIMYGPYLVEGERYYFFKGEPLNSEFRTVKKPEVEDLHNFYMKTYTDPLFYSPASGTEMNLSGFERFEDRKILTADCGLEYDLIPQEYFDSLEENDQATERFLERASRENAERLIRANQNSTKSYADFVGKFIELLNREVSDNRCFYNDTENNGIARATLTPQKYRIDTKTLLNYTRLANRNSKKLLAQISRRKEILDGEKTFRISSESKKVRNYSYTYNNTIKPENALEEMNKRIEDEAKRLSGFSGNVHQVNESLVKEHTHNGSSHAHRLKGKSDILHPVSLTPKGYDLKPQCLERDTVPVYGWDINLYPNTMIGLPNILEGNQPYLQDVFTVCRCPYVEITRLKWYVTDDLYKEISGEKTEDYSGPNSEDVQRSEKIFIEDPGEKTLSQVSENYREALKRSLKADEYDPQLSEMWRRSTRERSKLHKFGTTYDDFYNVKHMKVWQEFFPLHQDKLSHTRYNYFLLTESEYALNFMTWSESVWRLDEKPDNFSNIIDTDRNTNPSLG